MSSGVVSATDYFTALALGRAGFERLLRARVVGDVVIPPRGTVPDDDLARELEIRERRLEELREFAIRRQRVEELMNLPGYSVWTATPIRIGETRRPALSRDAGSPCTSTATPKRNNPWPISLRENAKPRFTIYLEGETARTILAEVADVSQEGLETGGLLFSWEHARSDETRIAYVSGAGNGSLHSPRSLLLAREEDVRAAFPDWLDGEALRRIGCWHYHPVRRASRPSRADLNAWANFLWSADPRSFPVYSSIIVTPGSGGLGPEFHGWVTHGTRGRYVCQPALLTDRLGYCS